MQVAPMLRATPNTGIAGLDEPLTVYKATQGRAVGVGFTYIEAIADCLASTKRLAEVKVRSISVACEC